MMPTKFPDKKRLSGHQSTRVAIADDHPLLLAGLASELHRQPGICVVGVAANSTALMTLLAKQPVDVVISDYSMPGGSLGDGTTLFGAIQERFPNIELIVLTMMSNPDVIRSLLVMGVARILSKADPLEYLTAALYAALAGKKRYLSPTIEAIVQRYGIEGERPSSRKKRHLSARELEVTRLFASGLTICEIADRLGRSKQTISSQKLRAMRKLGISRDADLIKYGIREQLTSQNVELHHMAKRPPSDVATS
jgi:DNA-binding NarL/FixJ family response regulator